MKASQTQRVLLYAVLFPLALLTCIWYLLQVIGTFDSSTAIALADSGLGPIGVGGVRGGSDGGVPLNSVPLITSTVITSYGPRTSWGDYPDRTSRKVYTYIPTETVTRTRFNGDIDFYTYDGLSTYYTPTTVTRYGYQTVTDWYTTTSRIYPGSGLSGRGMPIDEAQEPNTPPPDDTPAPGPTPAPVPRAAVPVQKRAVPERHELVKRRRGGGGGGSISSDDAEEAFMSYIPNFLGLFWSFAVILWLLILPCTSAASAPRSIASMTKTLLWFWLIGFASSLWTSIVIGVSTGRGAYVWGLWVCILVFAWLLTVALFATWLWLRQWSKKHANGQLYRSIESIEEDSGVQIDPSNLGKIEDTPQPPQLPYAAYPGAYPTPPPPGTDPAQTYNLPAQPASPPPPPTAPAGYVYALVPAPNGVQTTPSPPPTTYPVNMYQPQPVQAQGPIHP